MLNESELIELRRIADKAAEKIRHPDDCNCMAEFNRKFKPATCAALVREVLRLRQAVKDTQEDANSAAIEGRWQSSQGEDYGTY
jgi:hypothetical protein